MAQAQFFIPLPPTANSLFANAPGKGRVRTTKYRSWATAAGWMIKTQCVGPVPGSRWCVSIEAPIGHTRDLDNVAKPTLDLLVAMHLIGDDRYVDQITLLRVDPAEWPEFKGTQMRVTITPL